MEFLSEYGMFLLKALTMVLAGIFFVAGIAAVSRKPKSKLSVVSINQEYQDIQEQMRKETGIKPPKSKKSKKDKKKEKSDQPTLFILNFNGDIKASQVDQLRQEITAILSIATPQDEVLIKIESPGGSVNGYGLAASQLQRIRDKNIPLTASIDKVAASGGYLMACIANKIIAAPFAIIGSIGVVAQLPNFYRLLKKNEIDVELLTAGEYKRTLTLFSENTEKGRKKFKEDLEDIHAAFKQAICTHRETVNIDQVSTGEHWLAQDALKLNLVDHLQTSDDYLLSKQSKTNLIQISIQSKPSLFTRITKPVMQYLHPWA